MYKRTFWNTLFPMSVFKGIKCCDIGKDIDVDDDMMGEDVIYEAYYHITSRDLMIDTFIGVLLAIPIFVVISTGIILILCNI